jgi:hypothetical protein
MSFSPEELTRDSLSDREQHPQSIKSLWSPTWAHQCGDSNVAEPCFIGPRGLDVVEQPLATNSAPISRLRATLRQFESHPQFRSEKYVDDKIWTLPKPRLFSKRKSKNPTPVFSKGSRNLKDFTDIPYSVAVWSSGMPESKDIEAYNQGLDTARRYLASMIQELDLYADSEDTDTNIKVRLRDLFSRFHRLGRQLRARRENRETLAIDDEYDVQDLLHALLHLYSDDIRPEQWTPSYAGASSKMDFLLKKEKIVIEVKKTRSGLAAKEVGEQLIVDAAKYAQHPDCQALFCFVYDPEGRIANPIGIERDLARKDGGMEVEVFIYPKGT